jgi:hypothetical protein
MKAWISTLIYPVFLLALVNIAKAQNCQWRQDGTSGPGWYDSGGVPCNNNASQQSAIPPAKWASRWGAVANSINTGHAGTSAGERNARDANRIAMQQCGTDTGINDCKVIMTYHDQCAAIADGTHEFAAGAASTVAEASSIAMQSCQKKANDCKIIYTECSLPERIQ